MGSGPEEDRAMEGTRWGGEGEDVDSGCESDRDSDSEDVGEESERGDGDREVVVWPFAMAAAEEGQSSSISSSAEEKESLKGRQGAPRRRGEEGEETGEEEEGGGTNEGAGGGGGKAPNAPESSSSREAGVRHTWGGTAATCCCCCGTVSPLAADDPPCANVEPEPTDPDTVANTPNEALFWEEAGGTVAWRGVGVGDEEAWRKPSSSSGCSAADGSVGEGKRSGRRAPSCFSSSWMRRSMLLISTRRCRLGSLSERWLYSFIREMLKMVWRCRV